MGDPTHETDAVGVNAVTHCGCVASHLRARRWASTSWPRVIGTDVLGARVAHFHLRRNLNSNAQE